MASKVKYKFNPDTLAYEVERISIYTKLKRLALRFLIGSAIAIVWIFVYSLFFHTPKEVQVLKESDELLESYRAINSKLAVINELLNDMEDRDNNLYRAVFEEEIIPSSIREAGMGGVNRYSQFESLSKQNSATIIGTLKMMDRLQKKAYIQSKSFDVVAKLASNKTNMLRAMPISAPVDLTKVRFTSAFGGRSDPKYGDYRMHEGIDLAGTSGTPIYAPGAGVVIRAGYTSGYGNLIEIDHKFGYTTRFGHLSAISVTEGQKVQRGQVIGALGNTGKSTGAHLHYEVRLKSVPRNPLLYFENKFDSDSEELIETDSIPYGDETE